MPIMSINELREKEVINICDGKRLGFICDVQLNVCTGCVVAIVVVYDNRLIGFSKGSEIVIPWDKVQCFGKDAVLVNAGTEIYDKLCGSNKRRNEK